MERIFITSYFENLNDTANNYYSLDIPLSCASIALNSNFVQNPVSNWSEPGSQGAYEYLTPLL
jgi:hypothetical protein